MSNKTILQENNVLLNSYISRLNTAKNEVAELPDASSGGAAVAVREIVIRTKKSPMPTALLFVEYIDYVSVDGSGALTVSRHSDVLYMTTLSGVAVGTILFVKTMNSPSSCTVDSTHMELISFDADVGAVVKVVSDAASAALSISFA